MKKRMVLTPILDLAATKEGKNTWRKQILPKGSIDYKGRTLTFDEDYLNDLAQSFNDQAYDQVPVVFADSENRHNMDPKRFGGEVTKFEVTDDGLDAIVTLSDDATKAVGDNPRLGVSARIVEGLSKSDGRIYPRAIQHVLLTMDPRVTGMKPWQTVDLSGYDSDDSRQVVDLTAFSFERNANMPKSKETPKDGVLDLSELSPEELDALLTDGDVNDAESEGGDAVTPETNEGEGQPNSVEEANDEDDEDEPQDDADLSATPTPEAIDLAGAAVDAGLRDEVRQMQIDLAASRWENERREYAREGVPPFLLDLAAPLLSTPGAAVIDLSGSDGEKVNATETVRKMLDGVRGMVDLTPEIGHAVDLSQGENDPADSLLSAWDNEYGVR